VSRKAPDAAGLEFSRATMTFGVALLVLCATWFFGIATRVSLNNDIDIVARAGIFRVLTAGISDLVDTFLLITLATFAYVACLWALRREFRHSFAAAIAGTCSRGSRCSRPCR